MHHTTPAGDPKILPECTLVVTTPACVGLIVSDVAVLALSGGRVHLKEFAPGWTPADVQAITAVPIVIDEDVRELTLV